jgi:acylphosphatase
LPHIRVKNRQERASGGRFGMVDVTRSVHVLIEGRVQGVGFRAFVEITATGLGLDGWVRNRRDGAVEAVFVGPEDEVAEMLERCRRGPRDARVDRLEIIGEGEDGLDGFEVRPTV